MEGPSARGPLSAGVHSEASEASEAGGGCRGSWPGLSELSGAEMKESETVKEAEDHKVFMM
ncbi:hypothetical protein INR49_007896 [Caranx melampygus]|nr:hypothetical protein INR49_007896 [Caranx melampygus]